MAKWGNFGKRIPRDRELLLDLYWRQGLLLREIGKKFNVSAQTVARVMAEVGVERRRVGGDHIPTELYAVYSALRAVKEEIQS